MGGVTWNNIVTGLKGIQTNVSGGWQRQCETMRDCVRNYSRSLNFVLSDNGLTMQPFHWAKNPHSSTENVCWMAKWMSVDRSLRKSSESCLDWVLHDLTWLWGKQLRKAILEPLVQAFQTLSWCHVQLTDSCILMQVYKQGSCDYPDQPCKHVKLLCCQTRILALGAKIWEDGTRSYITS